MSGKGKKRLDKARRRAGLNTDERQRSRDFHARIRQSVVAVVYAPDHALRECAISGEDPLSYLSVIGSAFLIDQSGIVLTARHVIEPWIKAFEAHKRGEIPFPFAPKAAFVVNRATEPGGKGFTWGLHLADFDHIEWSRDRDIAAMDFKVPADSGLLPLSLSQQSCEDGDEIVTCGFPFGLNLHKDQGGWVLRPSFSRGIVSAALPFPDSPLPLKVEFQLDMMVNNGNSGGPVVDHRTGEVVGILTQAFKAGRKTADSEAEFEGLIPTGLARAAYIHQAAGTLDRFRHDLVNSTHVQYRLEEGPAVPQSKAVFTGFEMGYA